MGRKSEKTKEKMMKRKEESSRVSHARVAVKAANKLEDPMKEMAVFKKFDRNGLALDISCHKVTGLDEEAKSFVFDITKKNMESLYENSNWGWDDTAKQDEMLEPAAWYLIARDEQQKLVAMVHFRFDMDCDDEVLYCYEVQLTEAVRRKGLGKFLMQILELMAFKTNMAKVMLTVFKDNGAANSFFKEKLKYTVDETSPEEDLEESLYDDYAYEILSKIMKRKQPAATSSHNGHHHHNGNCC